MCVCAATAHRGSGPSHQPRGPTRPCRRSSPPADATRHARKLLPRSLTRRELRGLPPRWYAIKYAKRFDAPSRSSVWSGSATGSKSGMRRSPRRSARREFGRSVYLEPVTGVVTIATNANGRTDHRRLGPQRDARQAASARWREARSRSVMTADHEAAIRAATDALAAAILVAVRAEAVSNDAGPEQLLSMDRAAALAGVGRTTIYAAIGAGRLRSVKVGRRRLVPASAIADLAGTEQDARLRPTR